MMNYNFKPAKKKKWYIESSTLILLAFATAFFPRIIASLGAPKIINFLHFVTIPFAFIVVLSTTRTKKQSQISISWALLSGLLLLLAVITANALVNDAGIINVFIEYLLLAEPFMFLLVIVCIPMTPVSLKKFKDWFLGFSLINLLLALAQGILINLGILRVIGTAAPADNVQGVFYLSGAGNYVSASISLIVALYYFITAKNIAVWIRISAILAAFYQLLLSDSKQILVTFMVAWVLLSLTKVQNFGKILMYVIAIVITGFVLYWCIQNLEAFSAFKIWADRAYLYTPDGLAIRLKTAGIRIILSYYKSPLHWFFGLGPGHTIGRLGGWVLREYGSLMAPLGATTHPVSEATWQLAYESWLFRESTMFSPLFSWVGLWGDLGLLGVGAYLYLCFITWQCLCRDDFCKLLMLNVLVIGFIFTQPEEPGYMLTVAGLIALRWQERQVSRQARHPSLHLSADTNPYIEAS